MMDLSPETIPEEHVSQKENIIKAIVGDTYGSPDVLELRDIDKPEISDDEVLVRVHMAGIDRGVWHLMTGLPYVARLALGLRAPKNPVPGMDVAGVVEALGGSVTRFQPGDEVFGIGKGAFAEYARSRAQVWAQAGEPHLRAGGGSRHLQPDRPAGPARPREGRGGTGGFDHRRVGRCGHLCRADRQGVRRARNRRVRHREGGDGPSARITSSTGRTRSPRSPRPSVISKKDTLKEKSSSPCETQ